MAQRWTCRFKIFPFGPGKSQTDQYPGKIVTCREHIVEPLCRFYFNTACGMIENRDLEHDLSAMAKFDRIDILDDLPLIIILRPACLDRVSNYLCDAIVQKDISTSG